MLRVRTHTRRDRFAHMEMECCFASRRRSPVRTLGTAVEVRLVPNEPTVVSVVLVSEAEVATRSLYTIPKALYGPFCSKQTCIKQALLIPALYTPTVQTKEL